MDPKCLLGGKARVRPTQKKGGEGKAKEGRASGLGAVVWIYYKCGKPMRVLLQLLVAGVIRQYVETGDGMPTSTRSGLEDV